MDVYLFSYLYVCTSKYLKIVLFNLFASGTLLKKRNMCEKERHIRIGKHLKGYPGIYAIQS